MESDLKTKTTTAFIWSKILGTPFWALLNTLPIILYKEFDASPFLITLMVALKPASALLATYWSILFSKNEKLLGFNLVLTNILRFAPFLLCFFVPSPLLLVCFFCLYMTLSRGAVPAWTQMFKNHVSYHSQSNVFALGNAIEYAGMTIIPLLLGFVLDLNHDSWRWLFMASALLGISSTLFLLRIPSLVSSKELSLLKPSMKEIFLPWKRSFNLIKSRADFRRYLVGFMLGGAGLMIIQPVLPLFFVDVLNLSYTEMVFAMTVCKAIGFSIASPFWARYFKRANFYFFSACVALLAAFFPLLLLGAQWMLPLLFAAYLFYGLMQSGSELSWHMSATTFSKNEDSIPFSETNILAVGIRGCIVPFLGYLIFTSMNSIAVMVVSCFLCLFGTHLLYRSRKTESELFT